jgi:hypothetical protein
VPGRVAVAGAALVVGVLVGGCSPSTSSGAPSASGSTSPVQSEVGALVDIATPGEGWARASVADLESTLVRTSSEKAPVDAVPVLYVRDRDGTVTYATSGWSRTAATTQAAAVCEQAQRWIAAGETTYGLVGAAGQLEGSCVPTLRDTASGSLESPSPLAAACAAAVPDRPTTCARVDAVRTPTGQVRVVATVDVQGSSAAQGGIAVVSP